MILCKLWRSSACRLSLWESRAFEATDHFNENTWLSGTGGFVLEGSMLGREEKVYVGLFLTFRIFLQDSCKFEANACCETKF